MSSTHDGNGFPVVSYVIKNVVHKVAKSRGLDGTATESRAYNKLILGQPTYIRHENFTTVLFKAGDDVETVGVSKRNPIDRDSPLRGRSLALSRAIFEAAVKEIAAQ